MVNRINEIISDKAGRKPAFLNPVVNNIIASFFDIIKE